MAHFSFNTGDPTRAIRSVQIKNMAATKADFVKATNAATAEKKRELAALVAATDQISAFVDRASAKWIKQLKAKITARTIMSDERLKKFDRAIAVHEWVIAGDRRELPSYAADIYALQILNPRQAKERLPAIKAARAEYVKQIGATNS